MSKIRAAGTDKKFDFTGETMVYNGRTLRRICAVRAFETPHGTFRAGEVGGWLESEDNLSQGGGAWVANGAKVYGQGYVGDNAIVSDLARVFGAASVGEEAQVFDRSLISGRAHIIGQAKIHGPVEINGHAKVAHRADVEHPTDILWLSNVGSEHGTLTAYRAVDMYEDLYIAVTRGCFAGSLEEFEAAVKNHHGFCSYHGKQYRLLIDVIKHSITPSLNKEVNRA